MTYLFPLHIEKPLHVRFIARRGVVTRLLMHGCPVSSHRIGLANVYCFLIHATGWSVQWFEGVFGHFYNYIYISM